MDRMYNIAIEMIQKATPVLAVYDKNDVSCIEKNDTDTANWVRVFICPIEEALSSGCAIGPKVIRCATRDILVSLNRYMDNLKNLLEMINQSTKELSRETTSEYGTRIIDRAYNMYDATENICSNLGVLISFTKEELTEKQYQFVKEMIVGILEHVREFIRNYCVISDETPGYLLHKVADMVEGE